jgi:drug/metabolite transporter (DMT)-like permease
LYSYLDNVTLEGFPKDPSRGKSIKQLFSCIITQICSLGKISMAGIIFAVLSAITWGAGDFYGGLATRRHSQFQVLVLVSIVGSGLMLGASLIIREPLPGLGDVFWASSAGLGGAIGILALYYGLSQGNAAVVSPVAAVLSTVLPLLASLLTDGLPPPLRMAGLIIAVPGIWQVTRSSGTGKDSHPGGLGLAILAGVGFAAFFVLIAQIQEGQIFMPLVVSKLTAFVIGLLFLARRKESLQLPDRNPAVILAAIFDAAGNVFFLLAEQNTRLDIAAVLSSMYAAVTVLLSQQILKEKVTYGQWLGVCLCLLAIGLIVV